MTTKIDLPDTLANWKWPRRLNPHYPAVKKETAEWVASFGAFTPKAQHAFDLCNLNLLAALAYPAASRDHLRTGCDLMNLYLVFDEYSDVEDAAGVQRQADSIMDALRNPHKPRPASEWVGGEIFRQFWERAIKTASPQSQKRFINAFGFYTQAMVQQAADRSCSYIRDIDSYLEVRRETVAAKPAFALLELGMDLPDEIIAHPVIQNLSIWAIDMLSLSNDIVSYNIEQARGDDEHNIVTIVMNQLKTDVVGAMQWVKDYHEELERKFNEAFVKVPQWGEPIDSQVARYLDGIGNWVRGHDQWGYESERYFGTKGLEIIKTRRVTLMPKIQAEGMGPQIVDVSLL